MQPHQPEQGEGSAEQRARRWLAERGFSGGADGWKGPGLGSATPGHVLADEVADEVWECGDSDPVGLTFALLRLAPSYRWLHEMSLVRRDLPPDLRRQGLDHVQRALDSAHLEPAVLAAITYFVWVDLFEDDATQLVQAEAYEALAGDLVETAEPLDLCKARRLARLLPLMGPVAWHRKRALYGAKGRDPQWADLVLASIAASCRDVYGDIDPGEALVLLEDLAVQPGPQLDEMRHLLEGEL